MLDACCESVLRTTPPARPPAGAEPAHLPCGAQRASVLGCVFGTAQDGSLTCQLSALGAGVMGELQRAAPPSEDRGGPRLHTTEGVHEVRNEHGFGLEQVLFAF